MRGERGALREVEFDAEGAIVAPCGRRVPRLEITPEMVVNRTTVIFGPSGTGKTIIGKHILGVVRPQIQQVLVVSPSEPSNRAYEGFVDAPLIHFGLALAPEPGARRKEGPKQAALRFLDAIWKRQEIMASVYKKANEPRVLARLFRRIPRAARPEGIGAIAEANSRRLEVREALRRRFAAEPGRAADKEKEVNEKFEAILVLLYKKFITPYFAEIWDRDDLSEEERFSLNYLGFNPRLLLILDDCASELKAVVSSDEFKRFFYRGRHVMVTTVLLLQDDTDLPTNLRKNAFLSVFTDPIVARSNFDRTSNNFPRETKTFVGGVLPDVFRGNRKLVYIRDDPRGRNFYHLEVPYPAAFRFGSPATHELCDEVKAARGAIDAENPFYSRFRVPA